MVFNSRFPIDNVYLAYKLYSERVRVLWACFGLNHIVAAATYVYYPLKASIVEASSMC